MKVSEVIAQARSGELRSLSTKDKTDDIVIQYINLGLIELYKRFNLKTGVEVMQTSPSTPVYTLRNEDVNQVISIYDSNNRELLPKASADSENYDFVQINYNTFMFKNPKDEVLLFVYKAAPKLVNTVNDIIDLPYAMLEALLHYVGYRAHGALNGNIQAENNTHYVRFDKSCARLMAEGYGVDTLVVEQSVDKRGFL